MNSNIDMKQQERLWAAAKSGDCAEIRRAVISGADIDMKDDEDRNAFQIASQANRVDAMKTILAAKEIMNMEKMGIKPESYSMDSEEAMEKSEDGVFDKIGKKFFGRKSA